MNKRIVEFAVQARKYFPKTETSGEYWVFDEEKFAELIVRECIIISQVGSITESKLKQHFGVKE